MDLSRLDEQYFTYYGAPLVFAGVRDDRWVSYVVLPSGQRRWWEAVLADA